MWGVGAAALECGGRAASWRLVAAAGALATAQAGPISRSSRSSGNTEQQPSQLGDKLHGCLSCPWGPLLLPIRHAEHRGGR